jgi:hypothetical protein
MKIVEFSDQEFARVKAIVDGEAEAALIRSENPRDMETDLHRKRRLELEGAVAALDGAVHKDPVFPKLQFPQEYLDKMEKQGHESN